ncbi:MAG: ABC transporter ATP-binding protein [Candidatus Thorarchaeota archaeon]|nr:ABC transporter ATP-binding protein [Candidatus Thorarchaeota archaeon]MCK5238738.1 ABC transporter ATP-binding protein [Candidatus Thorarchaeota archaeon]
MGLILDVKNLTKKFGGLTAVNDFNFEIKRGEILGLIGPNGAGKTTLFQLLSGFEKPNSGTIQFDGVDITGKKPYQIVNLGMARTFQLVRSFRYLSLLDNISVACLSSRGREAFGASGIDEAASSILSSIGLVDKARLPPAILPHGDLRKLEIGKALGANPEMLLLDEPFSGLAFEEKEGITKLINRLSDEGVTIFVTGHVLRELMTLVPRVLAMHQGRLIAEGPPQEVANNRIVLEAYLGRGEAFA